MPRIKGSKNKAKIDTTVDYAAQIAEKQAAKDALAEEIATIGTNISALTAERKAKKTKLKKLDKEIAKLTEKKAAADQKAAEEAKQAEAIDLVKKALANGTTADEIIELLK